MLNVHKIAQTMQTLYGMKVVRVDNISEFYRDVTLITVEVPNKVLESAVQALNQNHDGGSDTSGTGGDDGPSVDGATDPARGQS